MKKILLLFTFITYQINAQCTDPIITDFECSSPSYKTIGALTTETNPFSIGINNSANVGKFIDDGTAPFDNLTLDKEAVIDLSTNNTLKFKVYSSKLVPLAVKLEGGTSPAVEIEQTIDVKDTWIEYTFDFSNNASENHKKIIIFFNFNETNGTTTDTYYIDDIRWETTKTSTYPVITDFESTKPSKGGFSSKLTPISNHLSSGINTSANIGKYKDDGTAGFDAIIFDYGNPIDLSTNNFLKIKLYSPKSIQILAKIEGGSMAQEVWSPFSEDVGSSNTWVEFTFDFSNFSNNASGGDGNNKLLLFVNAGKTDGTNSDIYYLDDIQWTSSATASINNFTLENQIVAYPTITKNNVYIKTIKTKIQTINVYDINGQRVIKNSKVNKQKFTLDVTKLSKGLYFVKVKSDDGIKDIKIIKQ